LKAVIVSYLNTLPLRIALQQFTYPGFTLLSYPPAQCYRMLLNKDADLGLSPVPVLMQATHVRQIGTIGICADEKVMSVGVFSSSPIDKIKKILLDPESRTSVRLLQVLCKHYWKIHPAVSWLKDTVNISSVLSEPDTGVLLIGNKALQQHGICTYYYDLAEAWKNWTGYPFVFAVWAGNKNISGDFAEKFDSQQRQIIQNPSLYIHHPEVISFGTIHGKEYLTRHIQYLMTEKHFYAIDLFLTFLKEEKEPWI
jgi:chorismate dehydratase